MAVTIFENSLLGTVCRKINRIHISIAREKPDIGLAGRPLSGKREVDAPDAGVAGVDRFEAQVFQRGDLDGIGFINAKGEFHHVLVLGPEACNIKIAVPFPDAEPLFQADLGAPARFRFEVRVRENPESAQAGGGVFFGHRRVAVTLPVRGPQKGVFGHLPVDTRSHHGPGTIIGLVDGIPFPAEAQA